MMRRWLLAFLCLALVGCGARGTTAPTTARAIRTAPSSWEEPPARITSTSRPNRPTAMPLLLVLHGSGGTGVGTITLTHMNDLADKENFIAVYPDGLNKGWADGRGASDSDQQGVDDVAFLGQLITTLQAQYAINPHRIYVAGMSNGGFMTQRLGCELANKIAAIVPVVATLSTNQAATCAPSRPAADPLRPR